MAVPAPSFRISEGIFRNLRAVVSILPGSLPYIITSDDRPENLANWDGVSQSKRSQLSPRPWPRRITITCIERVSCKILSRHVLAIRATMTAAPMLLAVRGRRARQCPHHHSARNRCEYSISSHFKNFAWIRFSEEYIRPPFDMAPESG
jgi:hypothetical protein